MLGLVPSAPPLAAEKDIGRAIAELSARVEPPAAAAGVREHVCISGGARSAEDAAKIVAEARGSGTAMLARSEELVALKQAWRKQLGEGIQIYGATEEPCAHMLGGGRSRECRLAMAENELTVEKSNQDEVVSLSESISR